MLRAWLFSTATMGSAPWMLTLEDRESSGTAVVLCLVLGTSSIASCSIYGFLVRDIHWFGMSASMPVGIGSSGQSLARHT